jgi:signal transduction histidine kinase
MDTTIFLTIILILVAVVLIAVGIYLVIVLNEIRTSLRRFNNLLGRVDSILEVIDTKIARPAGSLAGVFGIVKELVDIFLELKKVKKGPEDVEQQPQ